MLSKEKQREYYKMAEDIHSGKYSIFAVLSAFENYPEEASTIVDFWMRCDEFTQEVVHNLAVEKMRIRLEVCAEKEVNIWTLMMHNLRHILSSKSISSGLKTLLSLVDE